MRESKRARAHERDLISRERFNFDRMSGPVNHKFNFCELKLDHGDFINRSSIDHKMKFSLIADQSIDR